MEPPRPRPSLPPRPAAAPRQPFQAAQDAANHAPGNRRLKPLVYALGIAGIAGSGALIGAILKMSEQEEGGKEQARHQQGQTQQEQPVPTDYSEAIQTLETKRGHLMTQKIQLERKIQDLHISQHEKAEEQQIKKELGMRR
ncbi:hypothetical protein LTR10_022890 [Elasticomyces elasticus]|uniref:Uncharacterized protein n=1 Tax=Exophiala sideris TaxID=1016849 RepID=A0ABR0J937_9EURO|nr:hypothetical protein LTR10_022890 [Elasticomyces elasticus]KAK5022224.1 hypothetical protein LTS07_010304 [Exophiala sideris]KAK5037334.1 hypothetical protein LTR13_004490 [Exophiala sideris]KAK5058998.1 hypothetical protein LTR69_006285 [Exophiala sideris]KAK5182830.1 hypothetical protein LTR44_004538 [Eurotiomycetes sp. CCFEE 6388]